MRVLMVAYYFPPSSAIGAQRPAALAQHLTDIGDEVRVISCDPATGAARFEKFDGESPATGHRATESVPSQKRSLGAAVSRLAALTYRLRHSLVDWPDPCAAWRRQAYALASSQLAGWCPDIVISSSPPPSAHLLARLLAREFHAPWLPDYRDLWSTSTYYPYQRWRKPVDRALEVRCLKGAHTITAVTETFSDSLKSLATGTPVRTIMNGYSAAELEAIPAAELGSGFHLAYAGTWYGSKRDPEPVMRAMRDDPRMSDVVLHFVGPPNVSVASIARTYGLQDRVRFHGPLTRAEALGIVKGADVGLLLTWNDMRDSGVIPGKLYEYLGLKRPVLALGYEHGLVAQILSETGLGFLANTPDPIVDALSAIRSGLGPRGQFAFEERTKYERRVQLESWSALIRCAAHRVHAREGLR